MLIELMMAATDISLVPANLSAVCISNHGIFPYFRVFLGILNWYSDVSGVQSATPLHYGVQGVMELRRQTGSIL
jgi:hypothetical protein